MHLPTGLHKSSRALIGTENKQTKNIQKKGKAQSLGSTAGLAPAAADIPLSCLASSLRNVMLAKEIGANTTTPALKDDSLLVWPTSDGSSSSGTQALDGMGPVPIHRQCTCSAQSDPRRVASPSLSVYYFMHAITVLGAHSACLASHGADPYTLAKCPTESHHSLALAPLLLSPPPPSPRPLAKRQVSLVFEVRCKRGK